ncbi:sporulation protein YqfC [Thalassobacillus sp. CUG 92003]|uniref:sporulation protein YqfC n=1 Tax=Thalassobacillus sp. CUG 92003 TaxID=2736641 RepID=UPI0015E6717F|nr:sporulation protein YqfC [Thalassobacillus sp. CUG 92003]
MNRWQKKLRQFLSSYFDLPADVLLDLPRITTIGSLHVYIENHNGLLKFSQEEIRLKYRNGQICIKGAQFVLKLMLSEELLVEGVVKSIEFIEIEQ